MDVPKERLAWEVSSRDFPGRDAPVAAQLRFLVHYAVLAPSHYNSQPWYFRVNEDVLEVLADRRRALPVVDPHDREMMIACAAAVYNARIAGRYLGMDPVVEPLSDPRQADLVARIKIGAPVGKPAPHNSEDKLLYNAIKKRHMNWHPFDEKPVPDDLIKTIVKAANSDHAWLQVIRDFTARHQIAELVAQADREQFADKSFRRELASWLHSSRSHSADGLPGSEHGSGTIASLIAPFVVTNLNVGGATARRDHSYAEIAPALLILGTQHDEPMDWFHAGMAMQHVLLHLTAAGLSASFLNPPIQVEHLRPSVAKVAGWPGSSPQILLRIGHGKAVATTPRRGIAEVVRV